MNGAASDVHRLEFTIEPFEEGRPGPHVTAPIDMLRERGYDVEFGPFGSVCDVPTSAVGAAVALLVDTAIAAGASHVNIDVTRRPEGAA